MLLWELDRVRFNVYSCRVMLTVGRSGIGTESHSDTYSCVIMFMVGYSGNGTESHLMCTVVG